MGFNLTTDDVHDERERMGLNKTQTKVKVEWIIRNEEGIELFCGYPQKCGSFTKKHFRLTARWSKRGRWRKILEDNKYTITKQEK